MFHASTKHIEIDEYFMRDKILQQELNVRFVLSDYQLGDIMKKVLQTSRFQSLLFKLHVHDPPSCLRGVLEYKEAMTMFYHIS